jgi:hypothetical protein
MFPYGASWQWAILITTKGELPYESPYFDGTEKNSIDRLAQGTLATKVSKVGKVEDGFERRNLGPESYWKLLHFIMNGKGGFIEESS